MSTIVINLFGSAGSGKSTTAIGLTYFLRLKGYKVEYVNEYAKDLVNEGSLHKLKHQLYVFSKQLKRMEVLADKSLDFIVTDSPLILSYFYGEKYGTSGPFLKEVVTSYHNSFTNFNIFLNRVAPYDPLLRVQTEEESDEDSKQLHSFVNGLTPVHVYANSSEELMPILVTRLIQVKEEKV